MMQLAIPPGCRDALPPMQATSGASLPGGWLQELETQAHALSWFQGALGCRSCVAGATPTPAPGPEPGRVEAAVCPVPCAVPAEVPAVQPSSDVQRAAPTARASHPAASRAGGLPAAPCLPAADPASPWLAPSADAARGGARRAEPAAAPPAPPASQRPSESPAVVRVHVEQGACGLLVWVGVDGDAASTAACSTAILAQLRGAAALPLAALVCNGTLVYAAAAPRTPFDPDQEASWR